MSACTAAGSGVPSWQLAAPSRLPRRRAGHRRLLPHAGDEPSELPRPAKSFEQRDVLSTLRACAHEPHEVRFKPG
jgi:hypothetical protein